MTIPTSFWESLSALMFVITIGVAFYFASLVYNNIVSAHKKWIHQEVKYQNCSVYPDKYEVHNH